MAREITHFDRQKFFEQLQDNLDEPMIYNRLIALAINEALRLPESELENLYPTVDDVMFLKDPARDRYISVDRFRVTASEYGTNIKDRYLKVGRVPTAGDMGIVIPKSGIITKITAKSRSTESWNLEVRKNGVAITLVSLQIISSIGWATDIDVDVNEGDALQFFVDGTAAYPIVNCEIAWTDPSLD